MWVRRGALIVSYPAGDVARGLGETPEGERPLEATLWGEPPCGRAVARLADGTVIRWCRGAWSVTGGARWRSPSADAGKPAAMAKTFKKGDRVEWKSHGSKALGKVQKKITSETKAGGRKVKASKDEPQYLVKSEKSGGTAVHKPGALKKAKKKKD